MQLDWRRSSLICICSALLHELDRAWRGRCRRAASSAGRALPGCLPRSRCRPLCYISTSWHRALLSEPLARMCTAYANLAAGCAILKSLHHFCGPRARFPPTGTGDTAHNNAEVYAMLMAEAEAFAKRASRILPYAALARDRPGIIYVWWCRAIQGAPHEGSTSPSSRSAESPTLPKVQPTRRH